mmetsp:Transcript_25624/g.86102  ORF Transcript_25624/g.86102 Transcript_25624/m.86102 type:complete len:355 (+) Transcript_25624:3723-4787(+)
MGARRLRGTVGGAGWRWRSELEKSAKASRRESSRSEAVLRPSPAAEDRRRPLSGLRPIGPSSSSSNKRSYWSGFRTKCSSPSPSLRSCAFASASVLGMAALAALSAASAAASRACISSRTSCVCAAWARCWGVSFIPKSQPKPVFTPCLSVPKASPDRACQRWTSRSRPEETMASDSGMYCTEMTASECAPAMRRKRLAFECKRNDCTRRSEAVTRPSSKTAAAWMPGRRVFAAGFSEASPRPWTPRPGPATASYRKLRRVLAHSTPSIFCTPAGPSASSAINVAISQTERVPWSHPATTKQREISPCKRCVCRTTQRIAAPKPWTPSPLSEFIQAATHLNGFPDPRIGGMAQS